MTQGSRFAFLVLTLCFSAFIVGPAPAQALSWQVNGNGILTGATDVNVGGTLYDVEFLDGTCAALFNGCDANSDFTFQTFAGAVAASQALLDQVFVNTGVNGNPFGNFDSDPAFTQGCTFFACFTATPYVVTAPGSASTVSAFNNTGNSDSLFGPFVFSFDTTTRTDITWARWTPAANPVPEPATITLFGLGLGALVLWDYRRRQARRTVAQLD